MAGTMSTELGDERSVTGQDAVIYLHRNEKLYGVIVAPRVLVTVPHSQRRALLRSDREGYRLRERPAWTRVEDEWFERDWYPEWRRLPEKGRPRLHLRADEVITDTEAIESRLSCADVDAMRHEIRRRQPDPSAHPDAISNMLQDVVLLRGNSALQIGDVAVRAPEMLLDVHRGSIITLGQSVLRWGAYQPPFPWSAAAVPVPDAPPPAKSGGVLVAHYCVFQMERGLFTCHRAAGSVRVVRPSAGGSEAGGAIDGGRRAGASLVEVLKRGEPLGRRGWQSADEDAETPETPSIERKLKPPPWMGRPRRRPPSTGRRPCHPGVRRPLPGVARATGTPQRPTTFHRAGHLRLRGGARPDALSGAAGGHGDGDGRRRRRASRPGAAAEARYVFGERSTGGAGAHPPYAAIRGPPDRRKRGRRRRHEHGHRGGLRRERARRRLSQTAADAGGINAGRSPAHRGGHAGAYRSQHAHVAACGAGGGGGVHHPRCFVHRRLRRAAQTGADGDAGVERRSSAAESPYGGPAEPPSTSAGESAGGVAARSSSLLRAHPERTPLQPDAAGVTARPRQQQRRRRYHPRVETGAAAVDAAADAAGSDAGGARRPARAHSGAGVPAVRAAGGAVRSGVCAAGAATAAAPDTFRGGHAAFPAIHGGHGESALHR
eukprot:ctg_701.g365